MQTQGTDAVAITFDVPGVLDNRFDFVAGQWVTVRHTGAGRAGQRPYSICSPTGGPLRIGVRAAGEISARLVRDLRVGELIEVGEPRGAFGAGPAPGRALFVSAGSGITPVLSVIGTRLRDQRARIRLVRLEREPTREMFADEISQLQHEHPDRLVVHRVWTRGPSGGRPDDARWRDMLSDRKSMSGLTGAWLCGPYELLEHLRPVLAASGLPARRVHTELFAAPEADRQVANDVSTVRIRTGGRTRQLTVSRNSWLLDAVLRAGGDVPYSCRGAMCGACRALVRQGDVDMSANHYLGSSEVAAGYVLACRTVALSPTVSLDFDA